MDHNKYPVVFEPGHVSYVFLSEGPKGKIKKVVAYTMIIEGIYNLGFGDWDEEKMRIDDISRSSNGDMDKVLATVAFTVLDFIQSNPDAIIFIEGSSPARTRLYQMKISDNWLEISGLICLYGYLDDDWVPFVPGRNYEAFQVRRKKRKFE